MNNILLLYKESGETPLQCLERFKLAYPEYQSMPLTYAGRLDPMAEGLLLVLSGEEVYNKQSYLDLPKTYQFDVLWGFETDTYDALGLVQSTSDKPPTSQEIETVLSKYVGKRQQVYPLYSSKTVEGKPLFVWARSGDADSIEIPRREIEIFSLMHVGSGEVAGSTLADKIQSSLEKVKGDFRQEEIKEGWQKVTDRGKKYHISSFEMTCSSGTYVRSLAHDLGVYFGSGAIALHIKRLKIGPYSIADLDVDKG